MTGVFYKHTITHVIPGQTGTFIRFDLTSQNLLPMNETNIWCSNHGTVSELDPNCTECHPEKLLRPDKSLPLEQVTEAAPPTPKPRLRWERPIIMRMFEALTLKYARTPDECRYCLHGSTHPTTHTFCAPLLGELILVRKLKLALKEEEDRWYPSAEYSKQMGSRPKAKLKPRWM